MDKLFRMAVLRGTAETVQSHINFGSNINSTDKTGKSLLILAASTGNVEICRILLEAGANPAHKDNEGKDALTVAHECKHSGVMELLTNVLAGSTIAHLGNPSADNLPEEPDKASATVPCSDKLEVALASSAIDIAGSTPEPLQVNAAHNYFDVLDLSEWEAETELPPPPSDLSCAVNADEFQRQMSRHILLDTREDWEDVDIDLPEILTFGRRVKLDKDEEWVLRKLILIALRDGQIQGNHLAVATPRDKQDTEKPDKEIENNLRLMFGDLEVVIDDDNSMMSEIAETVIDDQDDELYDGKVNEALDFLQNLNSNQTDPLALYYKDIPNILLTREDEIALSMEIEAGMKDALSAIAQSPAAMDDLSVALDKLVNRKISLSEILDFEESWDANTEILMDFDSEHDESKYSSNIATSQELLERIKTVHGLCQQISAVNYGRIPLKFSTELGEHLFAIHLSKSFVAKLHHAIAAGPHGSEAKNLMDTGLKRAINAKNQFAEANLKLVIWVAKQFSALPLLDRIQEGNLGLMKAIERFDYRRGAKFSTYATWWIRQSIFRAIANTERTIRIPVHMHDTLHKFQKMQLDILYRTGRDATPEKISRLIEVPLNKVRKFMALQEEPVSMHTDDGWRAVESIADTNSPLPDESCTILSMQAAVRKSLDVLSEKQAEIIRMRFGIDFDSAHTLEEVGAYFGLTRERIRQIEKQSLKILGHPTRIKTFLDFL